jgi:hypothetical protein
LRSLHFSLAPRPRVILRRLRLLPTDGEVLLEVGDRVLADTVVARARGQGAMVTVNVASALDLRPGEVAAAMVRAVGDQVSVGEIIARTRGLWGWLGSVCRAPVGGTVAAVSRHTGQVLIERPAAPLEVRAYLPGIVAEVVPGRGVAVTGWGALVPGVFGVGGECAGELVLAVRRPGAVLTGELVGADHAGQILVAGAQVTADALARATMAGARGVIAGGVSAADLARFLGRELTVADTTEVPAPLTLVVLGGFGRVPLDRRVFALLAASEGRQACLAGVTRVRAGAVRPEIIIPLATPPAGGASDMAVTAALVDGCRVLVVREPWFGSRGRVACLPREPRTLLNEARCLVAEVDLDDGGTVLVPRANLEILGEPGSETTP